MQGQPVAVKFNVTALAPGAGTPTGTVTVSDGVESCSATVAAGECTVELTTIGARTLVATYARDANFTSAVSAGEPHIVGKPTAVVKVQDSTAIYGDAGTTLAATVTNPFRGALSGGTVTFTVRQGNKTRAVRASLPVNDTSPSPVTVALPRDGTWNADNYTIEARYNGDACCLPGTGSGTLTIQRKMLWLKPQDRTVGLRQPNPATTPPANCAAGATGPAACWLELTNGSSFVYGEAWSSLNLANLRFAYNRSGNGPATERVGAQYRLTVSGALSTNYDLRYQTGIITVVAP